MSSAKAELQYRIALASWDRCVRLALSTTRRQRPSGGWQQRNTSRKLFGNCEGYSRQGVIVLVLPPIGGKEPT